jgi:hypothetical protein
MRFLLRGLVAPSPALLLSGAKYLRSPPGFGDPGPTPSVFRRDSVGIADGYEPKPNRMDVRAAGYEASGEQLMHAGPTYGSMIACDTPIAVGKISCENPAVIT